MADPQVSPQEGTAPEQQQATQPTVQSLGADFFKPESEQVQPETDPTPTPPSPTEQQQQPEAQAPDYSQFDDYFSQRFGVDPESFGYYMATFQEQQQQAQEAAFKSELQAKLGAEGFDDRYSAINERFQALPENKQEALLAMGNVQAAILINQALEMERQAQQNGVDVPALDGNSTSGAQPKREYHYSEYIKLRPGSDPELEAEFAKAWDEGRIIMDA